MNASPYEPDNARADRRVDEPRDDENQPRAVTMSRAAPAAADDQASEETPDEPGYGHGV